MNFNALDNLFKEDPKILYRIFNHFNEFLDISIKDCRKVLKVLTNSIK